MTVMVANASTVWPRSWKVILRNNFVRQDTVGYNELSSLMPSSWADQIRRYPGLRVRWEQRWSSGVPSDETGFLAAVGSELEARHEEEAHQ